MGLVTSLGKGSGDMSERPSLSRQIAADLRGEILRGDLPPGAVLHLNAS